MNQSNKAKGLFKKTTAVILGITMSFAALTAMPESIAQNSFINASADLNYIINNNIFEYELIEREDGTIAQIKNVQRLYPSAPLTIPSSVVYSGKEYPVTEIGANFLKNDQEIKEVIFPDSVKIINYCVLENSSVESITLPDGLEKLGVSFARECKNINYVKYDGTGIAPDKMGAYAFRDADLSRLENEKGAFILGNWLINYSADDELTELRIADLACEGQKIENVASGSLPYFYNLKTLDLEGVKYYGSSTLYVSTKLKAIINANMIEEFESTGIKKTQWYNDNKEKGLVRVGKCLLYYKTDSTVIDLTKKELKGVISVGNEAFIDCPNVDTLMITSDQRLDYGCLHAEYNMTSEGLDPNDVLPERPVYKLKTIYMDGKKFEYDRNDPKMDYWVVDNKNLLFRTEWFSNNLQAKTKHIYEQLDMSFFGAYNDKKGTLSKTEEFYNALKIHDYMTQFQYHLSTIARGGDSVVAMLIEEGRCTCYGYCNMFGFLLDCAGVDNVSLSAPLHGWGEFRIGDEWFEADPGWDAQSGHTYEWFALSSTRCYNKDNNDHKVTGTYGSWHSDEKIDRIEAKRTLGDIDGDDDRDNDDALLLWAFLKGESDTINEVAADINFDGTIDITDGVLLENLANGNSTDVNNVPNDGLAPVVKVAFVNGKDYDNIKYAYTDRDGYIVLPADTFEAPEGKKLSYDIGKVGQKVKIHNPYQVIQTKWVDENEPDYSEPESSSESSKPDSSKPDSSTPESNSSDSSKPDSSDDSSKPDESSKLGDVNNDRTIDIEDAVAIIQHINGLTPLTEDQEKRADVSKDGNIDIDDAVILISYINGNSTF